VGGSAPLTLVHGRPVVHLDGDIRAVVDTAGAALLLAQDVADRLDLAVVETVEEQGEVFTVLEPPPLSVGGHALDTDGLPTYGFEDTRALGLAASHLDVVLPATLLQRHAVSLDVGEGIAWFGDAGTLDGEGLRVRADVATDTGLVTVTCRALGRDLTLLLDTGVSCSLAADSVVGVRVSAADFPGDALEALGARIDVARTRLAIDPDLDAGGCRIDLKLGAIDVEPARQWAILDGALAAMERRA